MAGFPWCLGRIGLEFVSSSKALCAGPAPAHAGRQEGWTPVQRLASAGLPTALGSMSSRMAMYRVCRRWPSPVHSRNSNCPTSRGPRQQQSAIFLNVRPAPRRPLFFSGRFANGHTCVSSPLKRQNSCARVAAVNRHVCGPRTAASRPGQRFQWMLTYCRKQNGQVLGAVLLQAGRTGEAETVYWEDLRRNPENGGPFSACTRRSSRRRRPTTRRS